MKSVIAYHAFPTMVRRRSTGELDSPQRGVRLAVQLGGVRREEAFRAGRAALHLELALLELPDLVILLLAAAVDDRSVQEGGHLVDLLPGPCRQHRYGPSAPTADRPPRWSWPTPRRDDTGRAALGNGSYRRPLMVLGGGGGGPEGDRGREQPHGNDAAGRGELCQRRHEAAVAVCDT